MIVVATASDCRQYLCDLGTPTDGLVQPVHVVMDLVQPVTPDHMYALRVLPEDPAYIELRLRRTTGDRWIRSIAFRPTPRTISYVVQQTWDDVAATPLGQSLLRDHVVVARQRADGGVDTLVDRKLRRRAADGSVVLKRDLASASDYTAALADTFGLCPDPDILACVLAAVHLGPPPSSKL